MDHYDGEEEATQVQVKGDGVPFFRAEEPTRAVPEEFFRKTFRRFGEWPEPEVVAPARPAELEMVRPEDVLMEEVAEEDDSVSLSDLVIDVDLSQLEKAPAPRGPAWLQDPRATVAIAYVSHLRPGWFLGEGSDEERRIVEFRHLLPAALGKRGLALERVVGGWQVRGTL